MQLKDKVDFSYLKSKKSTIFKVVLSLLKFIIITAIIWVGFFLISYLKIFDINPGIPQNLMVIIFTVMYGLSILGCSFGLMKALYEGRDNQLLLTFPAKRITVFTSKLIVYYIYELLRNITYLLPLFVAYGIMNKLPIYFYLWLVVVYFLIVAIPVVIGALLSIPTMYIVNFIRQHKWLEYILLVGGISLVVWVLVSIIHAIPENLDLIGSWGSTYWELKANMEKVVRKLLPFYFVVVSIVGKRVGVVTTLFPATQIISTIVMLVIVAVVISLTYLIVRPLYFKMTSSPFEFKKVKVRREHKNKRKNSFVSAIWKDLTLAYRNQSKFYSLVGFAFGLPIAILLLNKLYAAMDTRLTGTNMTVGFNILMILLIALTSSINMAHIYSEEGASGYLLKTNPKSYLQTLFVKLVPNILSMTVSLIATVSIMATAFKYTFGTAVIIFIFVESIYLAHLLMSAEMDIMNPQTAHYQTVGSHPNNPNDLKSTLYSFLLSAAFAFLVYFLVTESLITVWWKVMAVAVAFLVLRIWLYVNKIKAYFKERQ